MPLSIEARQLYEWMRDQLVVHGDLLVFTFQDASYRMSCEWHLQELHKAGWIKKHQDEKLFVLGNVVVQHSYFCPEEDVSVVIDALLSRYSTYQQKLIEQTFELLGRWKRTKTLSPLQKKVELEYFNKFPTLAIELACATFNGLDPTQKFQEAYLRGIIRNQVVQNNPAPIVTPPPIERPKTNPHQEIQRRNEAVTRIFNERTREGMSYGEQSALLKAIEDEVNAGKHLDVGAPS